MSRVSGAGTSTPVLKRSSPPLEKGTSECDNMCDSMSLEVQDGATRHASVGCGTSDIAMQTSPSSCSVEVDPSAPVEEQLGAEVSRLLRDLAVSKEEAAFVGSEAEDLKSMLRQHAELLVQCQTHNRDLENDLGEVMGKLQEETERRIEAQKMKEGMYVELEELTSALFEASNQKVRDEALRRQGAEVSKRKVEEKLEELRSQMEIERQELRELKAKMLDAENSVFHRRTLSTVTSDSVRGIRGSSLQGSAHRPDGAVAARGYQDLLTIVYKEHADEVVLGELRDFISETMGRSEKKLNIMDHRFVQRIIKEDVENCLPPRHVKRSSRLLEGLGARTHASFRRALLDAVLHNGVCIERVVTESIMDLHKSPSGPHSLSLAELRSRQEMDVGACDPQTRTSRTGSSQFEAELGDVVEGSGREKLGTEQYSPYASLQTPSFPHDGPPPSSPELQHCEVCMMRKRVKPFRMRLEVGESPSKWRAMCGYCRDSVVACVDLCIYLRHVAMGIVTDKPLESIMREVVRLRRRVALVRLGWFPPVSTT